DLERFLAGDPISARPIGSLERGIRWSRKHPARVLNIAGIMLIFAAAIAGWLFLRAREREVAAVENAVSLVEQLNVASATELPKVVQQVQREPRTRKLLDAQYQSSQQGSAMRYRAAVSLLPVDESYVNDVCMAWMHVPWSEWVWMREQLSSHREAVFKWSESFDREKIADLDDAQYARFEAMTVFAESNSNATVASIENPTEPIDSERIVLTLVDELRRDPTQLSTAANAFFPLRDRLGPSLSKRMDYRRTDGALDASIAASLTAELFGAEPEKLVEYGRSAKSEVFTVLFGNPKNSKAMQQEMHKILDSTVHGESWDESNAFDRRRAIAATILFRLGDHDSVWPLLCHQTNPSVRSLLMEWIPILERNPAFVLSKLNSLLLNRPRHCEQIMLDVAKRDKSPNPWLFDDETSQLRGLVQTLGNYSIASVKKIADESFWESIQERFELDPDPGIHASCEWLLRRHSRSFIADINHRLRSQRAQRTGWIVNASGHVMAQVRGPIEYTAGATIYDPDREAGSSSDPVDGTTESWSEDDPQLKKIPRSFSVALHETRLSQMHEFDNLFHVLHNKTLGPTLDHPASKVSWHKAAAYCNWLSQQEGVPEDQRCFIPVEGTDEMRLAPQYLSRTGYRLPTEAEWEYVCRAGTTTRRYFGDTDELLNESTWHMLNSREKILSIPGRLKPNELGLFDALGNVAEWCLDEFDVRTPGMRNKKNDIEGALGGNISRIIRGGSIYSMSEDVRASEYSNFFPSYREGNTGFRIARTIAPIDTVESK
ncbi:MAG: SUMF1/EgtB/PvdO family nonheme iron enzyme, partial [Pirellula sp.]